MPGLGIVLQAGVPAWLTAFAALQDGQHLHHAPSPVSMVLTDGMAQGPAEARAGPMALGITPELLPVSAHADLTLLLANLVISSRGVRPAHAVPHALAAPGALTGSLTGSLTGTVLRGNGA